ncbi:MAG TPA: BamA/TamA family outer membrane protein [Vicinamibacterales bacterium]
MARTRVRGARSLRAICLVAMAVTILAVPRLCVAQDDRSDDPQKPPPKGQAAGAVGSTTVATPTPVATTGVTPAAGTNAAQITPTTTPITGLFKEPELLARGIDYALKKFDADDQRNKSGFYVELSNMITGSGWISAGPGYRRWVMNDKAFYDASAAVSWHLYTMAQTRFEAPDLGSHHLQLGVQAMYQDQTQINFFGIGPNSPDLKTQYRLKSTDTVGYASIQPWTYWTLSGEAGYLFDPTFSSPTGTFRPNAPPTQDIFPDVPGVTLAGQPNYVHAQAAFTGDTRDYRGHPTRGGVYRASAESYNDQDTGLFTFRQYQAEALQLVRVTGPNWLLAFHGWLVTSDVNVDHQVPFYLLPSLGGATSLRSFQNYRFHDLNALMVNAESRWAIYRHVDLAAFVDAGNVAPTVGTLNIDHTSVGAGLRFHAEHTNFARFDIAHGSEGWQVWFRTGDFFRLARLTRRVADIPFVP